MTATFAFPFVCFGVAIAIYVGLNYPLLIAGAAVLYFMGKR